VKPVQSTSTTIDPSNITPEQLARTKHKRRFFLFIIIVSVERYPELKSKFLEVTR
jgi:hypothetical protein